ncbi:MAG: FimB/Mfa2 family fimbrial subunit [Bacteroidales bacterium]
MKNIREWHSFATLLFLFCFACTSPKEEILTLSQSTSIRLQGADQQLDSELATFGDFYLCIFNKEDAAVKTVSFSDAGSIPTLVLEPGDYHFLVAANASDTQFSLPEGMWQLTSLLTLSEQALRVPQLCFGRSDHFSIEKGESSIPVQLKRMVGKIHLSIANLPTTVSAVRASINNMHRAIQTDGTFTEELCTFEFNLEKGETEFSASDIVLFPTEGNIDITYLITEGEQTRNYRSELSVPLQCNNVLRINTRLEEIKASLQPSVSLIDWDEEILVDDTIPTTDETLPTPPEEEDPNLEAAEIRFRNLPTDFSAVRAQLHTEQENLSDTIPGIVTEGLFRSEAAPAQFALKSVRFFDEQERFFTVYFNGSQSGPVEITSANPTEITLPPAPELRECFGGGIVISKESETGYNSYKVRIVSVDTHEAKFGSKVNFSMKSETDARINDQQLTRVLEKYPSYTLSSFPAFEICRNYRAGGYNDWLMPVLKDIRALNTLYNKSNALLNEALTSVEAKKISANAAPLYGADKYLISNEPSTVSNCFYLTLTTINAKEGLRTDTYTVRAVRYLE